MSFLCSINLVLQTAEFLKLRNHFEDQGIWSWKLVGQERLGLEKTIYDFIFLQNHFNYFLWLRLILSVSILFTDFWFIYLLLFFSTLLLSVRCHGPFNGGSDYMTALTLLAMTINSPWAYCYLALQVLLSYFISGLVKLKSKHWRNGCSLSNILQTRLQAPRLVLVFLSWAVIIFELLFPFAVFSQSALVIFMVLGIIFHLSNVYILGLNRFFWSWLAAYPSLLVLYHALQLI